MRLISHNIFVYLSFLCFLCFLSIPYVATAASHNQPIQLNLLTAPIGTGSYVMGATLESMSKTAKLGFIISSRESNGFVYNIKKLSSDKESQRNTIVGSGAGLLSLSGSGEFPFRKKHKPLKLLANYYVETTFLATLDPDIKSVHDLKGKTIALGRRPQINYNIEPLVIMRHGIGVPDGAINIQHTSIKQGIRSLLNGTVDAAIMGVYFNPDKDMYVPSPQALELLSSGRSVYYIPWGKEAVKKAHKRGLGIKPYTLPAGSIEHLDHPLDVYLDTTSWMVSTNFPEDLGYQITKMIIKNVREFHSRGGVAKLISKGMLHTGWDQSEIAPGALKAYKESGLIE